MFVIYKRIINNKTLAFLEALYQIEAFKELKS